MLSPAISIQNACLRYRNHILFDRLNLALPAGKTTCLLGASGIGKTSLLRMMAGLSMGNPTQESADITASDGLPLQHRLSYLAQTDLLLPWLTCLQNALLGYHLRNNNTAAAREQAQALLIKVGLGKALHQYPHELSGGMRQRVALVRTLMEDKPIILMDEPFSALDSITRLQLQTLTAELIAGKTALLVTHDPLEALRLGHQVIVMSAQPAQLSAPLVLHNTPPRALTDSLLLQQQGQLMQQLANAQETSL